MYGQVVVGPPGAGKSTYCHGMYQLLSAIGRKCAIVNLDPANEHKPYPKCALDIRQLVTSEEVMSQYGLGPNGGLMHALESVDENDTELLDRVHKLAKQGNYLIFDCPGQVELITHNNVLFKMFHKLDKLGVRLCVVSLVDLVYLTSASQYISIVLLSLRAMVQLNLPHVNVISKIDVLHTYGPLLQRLDFYTQCQDLALLQTQVKQESNSVLGERYVDLTQAIADLVENFGLVSYEVLAMENKRSMISLLSVVDRANGYVYGTSELSADGIWSEASRNGALEQIDVHERWITHKAEYDKAESETDATNQVGSH